MTKIADMGPDIIYIGATVENNTPKVVLDLRSLMPVDQVTCLVPDGLITSAYPEGAGHAAEGSFVTFAGLPPSALKGPGADYATRMTDILGHAPDSYSVYAYEVVAVIIQAIDQVQEKDRGQILDAMMATKNFKSLLGGTWSFTETGDTDAVTMSINEVRQNDEGKLDFEFIETIGS